MTAHLWRSSAMLPSCFGSAQSQSPRQQKQRRRPLPLQVQTATSAAWRQTVQRARQTGQLTQTWRFPLTCRTQLRRQARVPLKMLLQLSQLSTHG